MVKQRWVCNRYQECGGEEVSWVTALQKQTGLMWIEEKN